MQTCVGCGKGAPETDTNYTLISAQFGWRLTRVKKQDGTITLEWRCPDCWRDHKKVKSGPVAGAPAKPHLPEMPPPARSPFDTFRPGAVGAESPHEIPTHTRTNRVGSQKPLPVLAAVAEPRKGRRDP